MTTRFSPDDARLTAYALGEVDDTERAEIEAQLQDDPAGQAVVEEIRRAAARLEAALAAEPMPAVRPPERDDPYRRKPGRMLRFPGFYYAVATLAAACIAVLVAVRHPEPKRPVSETTATYELNLPATTGLPPAANDGSAPAEAADQARVDEAAARRKGEFQAALQARMRETMNREARTRNQQVVVTGREAYGAARTLASFPANMALPVPDDGYLKASAGTATRVGTESQRHPRPTAALAADAEAYAHVAEAGFIRVADEPLSTFSADVDTASYANVRRFIARGVRPPADAVRIEELLNYFPYDYAPPADGRPFAASLEVASAPWAPGHRLVRIGLKGREVSSAARPAANLVFLLDVSGSMDAPNKLPLVKQSLRRLVGRLRPDDRVAIVTYAGASGLALPSTPVREAAAITAALDELAAAGSTNGERGIQLAYDIAKANFVRGGLNRVILCTDGDFNVGVSDEGGLVRLVEARAKSGVFLSVLGFGMGNLKDSTLEQLADKGNGSYGYIDSAREAEKIFVEQVNGTLMTIAKDVKLQVEFNPAQVAAYRLIGYENRRLQKEEFNDDRVDAGEVGAGHTVTALYEVVPAGADEPSLAPPVDDLKYGPPAAGRTAGVRIQVPETAARMPRMDELLTLKVRFKAPDGDASERLDFPLVDRGEAFAEASADFKFASAVAGFGMLLRDSSFKGATTAEAVEQWAQAGVARDPGGYRAEFLQLVRQARPLLP